MERAVFITKIGTIEIDSCLDESHTLANTVTDHPVEEGFNISDHSRPNPDIVRLRCFVSNTPLSVDQVQRSVRSGSTSFTTSAAASARLSVEGIDGRGESTYRTLQRLRLEGSFVDVVTSLRTFTRTATEGMTIESISIPRTRLNYDGLEFDVQLKQIRIVRNRSTTDQRPRDKRARKKEKKGAHITEENFDSKLSRITGIGAERD